MSEQAPASYTITGSTIMGLTAGIVSAYVSKNPVPVSDLPNLINSIRSALVGTTEPAAPAEPEIEKPTPAQIKKSVTPDAIISFIDGKPYKSMRRHLTTHGLTPESYRVRYGLAPDYPVVSATYSAARSELAKQLGLGSQRRKWADKSGEAEVKPKGRQKAA